MLDALRPVIARLIASIVPLLLVKVFALIGVPMPEELPSIVSDICYVLVIYSVTHRLVNIKLNPGDAASSTITKLELSERAELRNSETPK